MYIECRDITLSYENKTVLSGLSFSVEEGDFLMIAGENGSGKSTLVKALLSLHPVKDGEIKFDSRIKKDEIGYLPQIHRDRPDFPATVYEVVLSGCGVGRFMPFHTAADRKKAKEVMEKLNISDLRKKPFSELSGGQKQKTLLARALCAAKKLLLIDEPTTGLDPSARAELYDIIGALHREGMTVIMISHEEEALKYAGKVLHLCCEPPFFGSVEEFKESEEYKHFFVKR